MSFSTFGNNTSRNPDARTTTKTTSDPSIQKTIGAIRDVASNIRKTSSSIRDLVRVVHRSGAIDDFATAVHEAMIATRDTTKEIGETAKELKERGIIRHNVEEAVGAGEKGKMVKHNTRQVGESASPNRRRRYQSKIQEKNPFI
jgi:hypothetical protein